MRGWRQPLWIFVVVGSAVRCAPADRTDGVKVGVFLPFTGTTAANGANFERSILMVQEIVNQQGGISGKPLNLSTADTHGDVGRTLEKLDQMIDEGVVAIVGPESAEIALAIHPVVDSANIVLVSPFVASGTEPELTPEKPWIRTGPSAAVLARGLARDALEQSVEKLAILTEIDDYSMGFAAHLAETFAREGGVVLKTIALSPESRSYVSELGELQLLDFDAVALVASPKAGAIVVNELSFLRRDAVRLFLGPALETEVFLANTSKSALENARGVAPDVAGDDEPFDAAFRDRWADDAVTGSHYYYDAMALLSLALAAAGANGGGALAHDDLIREARAISQRNGVRISWKDLPEALERIARGEQVFYQGLTGTMIMDNIGQRLQASARIWTVQDLARAAD